jgi:leader peptidase (prepilin peptidase)/N-methyltransferase
MPPALIAAAVVAGAGIGWVQRAVIIRLAVPSGEPPGTDCPACGHGILRAARVPLPALPWFSRCRGCNQRAGPPALAVELTTAALFGAVAARAGPVPVFAATAWLVVCGVPLAFIDLAVRRLPDVLVGAAYSGVLILLALAAWTGGNWGALGRAAAGGAGLAAGYLVLALARPAEIGLGDGKAAAAVGTLLAWFSWEALIAGTVAGLLLAALYGAALLISRRATLAAHIAFGPFMFAGAFAVILAWPGAGSHFT